MRPASDVDGIREQGILSSLAGFPILVTFAALRFYTGFFVGAALLVGALLARAHARATWLASRQRSEP